MEKYLIIIGILLGLYFIYKYNQSITENFEATAQSLGGVDDTNSINTLAQISRKLMDGNLKVPGSMTVDGVLTSTGHTVANNQFSTTGPSACLNFYDRNDASGALSAAHFAWYNQGNLAKLWNNGDQVTIDANGQINANVRNFNTRIGQIWTAPGIYAEGNKNLEVGAGSGTVFIGAANGGANQNLNVTGRVSTGVNVWNTSMDGKNRTYYANNDRTYYGSSNGVHTFRDGENGGGADLMSIVPGKVRVEGRLFIRRPNMQATDGYDGPGQIAGTSSLDDCAQKCIDRAPQTQVTMRRKSDGFCWCKDANLWMHQNGDFDSMITF